MATVLQDGINSLGDLIGGSTTQHTTTVTTTAPATPAAATSSGKTLEYVGIAAGGLVLLVTIIWLATRNAKGG